MAKSIKYDEIEGTIFFNSSRTYTLSLLNYFSNFKHYVKKENGDLGEKNIPIQFGNYEKSIALEDIEGDPDFSNWNIVPRMILSFEGMNKAVDRTLNKDHKLSMKINEDGIDILRYTLNSVPYDFEFKLLIQTRGMNEAFQIVEQILPHFRPSLPLEIKEFPLFEELTKTQLLISDPSFEINEDFEDSDINIINISFDLTLRGNLYLPISLVAPIKTLKMFYYILEKNNIEEAKLASRYKWNIEEGKINNLEVEEHYAPSQNIKIIKE